MPPPVPSGFRPGKTPGDLGGETPACFKVINGGDGLCHCQRVELLLERVKTLQDKPDADEGKGKDLFGDDDPCRETREAGRRIDAEERCATRDDEDDGERFDLARGSRLGISGS